LKEELHGGKLEEKGSSRGRKVASVELERDEGRVPPVWSLEGKEGGRKAHEGRGCHRPWIHCRKRDGLA
jgi:hypothetical protein